jgi:hypothetical protein
MGGFRIKNSMPLFELLVKPEVVLLGIEAYSLGIFRRVLIQRFWIIGNKRVILIPNLILIAVKYLGKI